MNTVIARMLRACLFILVGGLVLPFSAAAQELPTGTFVVRPAKVEIALSPGESQVVTLDLMNGTEVPLDVSTTFEDVAPATQTTASEEPIKLLGDTAGTFTLREVLHAAHPNFQLPALTKVAVPIEIRLPRDAQPGGRYGSVVFQFTPIAQGASPQAQVAVANRIAVVFFVRVKGEVKEEGKLVKFGVFNDARIVGAPSQEDPIHFQVVYENTGTVHENPHGVIRVHGQFGEAKELIVDPFAVLPGAMRMRDIELHAELLPGYYRADLELARGYGTDIDTASVSFFVLPSLSFAGVSLLIMIAVFFLIRRSLRISRSAI